MPHTSPPPVGLPPAPSLPPAPTPHVAAKPVRRHRLRWTLLTIGALAVIFIAIAGWLFYRAIAVVNTQKLDGSNRKLSFFQQLTHLVTQQDAPLQGEREDRINTLLLGIGGPGHDGPYLTDTIMVMSFKPSTNEVAMLSIPRDLVVNIPGYDYRKINNVLSFGRDQKYPGGGEVLVAKVVSDFLDVPIHYYARIDFNGFEDAIDALGGVHVTVARAFSDFEYPDNNYGYQTVRFKAGPQTMNGDLALKFARSRHGNNNEGSDFARAARQQKVLVATKDKALGLGTLANPKKIADLLGVIGEHHQTNMEVWEMVRLAKLASGVKNDAIVTKVLDNGVNGLLKQGTGLGGAYILQPVDETLRDIHFLTKNIFLAGRAEREQAGVVIGNASAKTGLAEQTRMGLEGFGLSVQNPFTLRDPAVLKTVIVDTSNGKYPATTELLGRYARAQGVVSLTTWESQTSDTTLRERLLTATTNRNANTGASVPSIALILGQDQSATARSITTRGTL